MAASHVKGQELNLCCLALGQNNIQTRLSFP